MFIYQFDVDSDKIKVAFSRTNPNAYMFVLRPKGTLLQSEFSDLPKVRTYPVMLISQFDEDRANKKVTINRTSICQNTCRLFSSLNGR